MRAESATEELPLLAGEGGIVDVLVAAPVAGVFSYRAPSGERPPRGQVVVVPFGRREELGIVLGAKEGVTGFDPGKLKTIARALPAPPLKASLIDFIDWVARYNCVPAGMIAKLALRVPEALEAPPVEVVVRAREDGIWPERLTAARARVKAALGDGLVRTPAELARECSVSGSVIEGLVRLGLLERLERLSDAPFLPPRGAQSSGLSKPQASAAEAIGAAVAERRPQTFLLDGVTGSGKTEVYFDAIARAVNGAGQALVLLPEIALTGALLARFSARFGAPPAEWHSDLSRSERRRTFAAVHSGQARVVVGARSALFLPFTDLRLIVVDEEHDQSFKQEEGVIYHARDMALVRASLEPCPVVLASATPSLETDQNARAGRFTRLVLGARHGVAVLPSVRAIDLRKDVPERGGWLAPGLVKAMSDTLAAGEQSLLFLNRRGYAPLTICRTCGHRMMSPHASSWLVEHRFTRRLVCHVTGFSMPKPDECPACGAADSLVACGPGIERIVEEVTARFPQARIAAASSDLLYGPSAAQTLFEAMAAGEIDILIGTQIVAKGHNFPGLTLVGVVDADLGLAGGDLRAAERTYQLLHQVSGRAGRAERPGQVILQTRMPDHPVIEALIDGGRDAFLEREAAAREVAGMPPFMRLASLIVSGASEREVLAFGAEAVRAAPASDKVTIWGPATAPIAVVRGRHRARLLVRSPRGFNLSAYVAEWVRALSPRGALRVQVDIDPYSFL